MVHKQTNLVPTFADRGVSRGQHSKKIVRTHDNYFGWRIFSIVYKKLNFKIISLLAD
jgi:hypothetical protein